jgi:hypothetical protein
MNTKVCRKCNIEKPETSFYQRNKTKGHLGLKYMCKECENKTAKERYHQKYKHNEEAPKKTYINKLKREYNLTEEDFLILWNNTKGRCGICNTEMWSVLVENSKGRIASVDNCHDTGVVRVIICHKCNGGLGQFDDKVDFLKKAVKYL